MVHLTGPDAETIAVYDAKRLDYEKMVAGKRENGNAVALAQQAARTNFLDGLPPNAVILDYGCGPGLYVVFEEKPSPPWDAALFADMNAYVVSAFDGSMEMVKLTKARSAKVSVKQATFDDFTNAAHADVYDGIWASSSLLHARRGDMPAHLKAIRIALKPGGKFFIGMKTGEGELRDEIGRLYTYYSYEELEALLVNAGFSVESHSTGTSVGLDNRTHSFVQIFARRADG